MYFHHYNIVTPLGWDMPSTAKAMFLGKSAIERVATFGKLSHLCMAVCPPQATDEAFGKLRLKGSFSHLEKLLLLAAIPLLGSCTPDERTVLILSTTKGNISALGAEPPLPYLSALAQKIADVLGISTPPVVVSNACVSGAMALSVAQRLLQGGVYNSALVVAGDEVSEFVLSGFGAFQAMSAAPCKPYDAQREGISLGEAAAAVYLSTQPQGAVAQLLGSSSINDANHISGPSRTGEGLYRSVTNALAQAQLLPQQIDFINAHGTGTLYNDEMESIAFGRANLTNVPLNSYKGYLGHTLGAAGLVETLLSIAFCKKNTLLKSLNFEELGVSVPIKVLKETVQRPVRYFLKTASGFGGSNTALVIGV